MVSSSSSTASIKSGRDTVKAYTTKDEFHCPKCGDPADELADECDDDANSNITDITTDSAKNSMNVDMKEETKMKEETEMKSLEIAFQKME
ncbi:hypothetical protein AC249_AIPGENE25030 [Exaiptasia diaphana]|nr:hypothetical protein AC249_AIPGENE25030 [Exaiptasia diaphana]